MRRHVTYANVAATLALVLSMTGGALAAKHYLISSTKQISPKVLHQLRGNTGKTGSPGATGKEGAQGKEGLKGGTGAAGADGSAVAYARVEANGTLVEGASKNIASVRLSATPGVYCITPSVPVHSITVSEPHVGGDEGGYAQANLTALDGENLNCPTEPAYALTWKFGGTKLENHSFYVVFN